MKINLYVAIRFISLLALSSLLLAEKLPLYFEGQTKINERELYAALNLKKPYFYEFYKDEPLIDSKSVELLTQVIQNYYRTKGYYRAKVSYSKKEASVLISIRENDPMLIQSVEVDSALDIRAVLPFKKGDLFAADAFTQSKKDIKLFYSKESYCAVSLDAKAYVDTQKNSARVVYVVDPKKLCYFKNVEANASQNIDAGIAKSLLYFEEGDLFSLEEIKQSYKNVYAYEGVSKALIGMDIENNDSVNVQLQVTENEKPLRFLAGLGYSSDEGVMAQTGIKHRNFYGNLKTLGLEARVTQIKQTLKTNFDAPLLHKQGVGVEVGLQNEIFDGFTEYRLYASSYLTQRYLPHTFKESIVLDRSSTYDSKDLALFPEGALLVVSPKLEWNYDTRDELLDPKSGYFLGSEFMGSVKSSVSDASYSKIQLKGGYIYPLYTSTLAVKIAFGTLKVYDGEVPASYRFFAGGMHSNRAYSYRDLGPKNSDGDSSGFDSIVESTLEYRFSLYGDFRAVIFNDNTFARNSYLSESQEGYHSAGVGLRYLSPIGPIALDVGFDLSDPSSQYAFHFHIGELF